MNTPVTTPVVESPDFNTLISQYKVLSTRSKAKIRRAFNLNFGLSDDDSIFSRLIGGTLRLCVDEYEFLCPLVTKHYLFFVSHPYRPN
jgi:hypothetical protein